MSFFESLLVLVLASILLLQVSRRLSIPYPAMLATAGVVLVLTSPKKAATTAAIEPTFGGARFVLSGAF